MKLIAPIAAALIVAACANSASTPRTQGSAASSTVRPQPSAEVREAQQRLTTLGFYKGAVDGLWGPETQTAMQRFQQSRAMPVSSRLDTATISAIQNAESAPITISDPTDVRTIQNRLRQLNFYNQTADGIWGSSTQVALENFQRARNLPIGQTTAATITALGLNVSDFSDRSSAANRASNNPASPVASSPADTLDRGIVRAVQQRLRQQGFLSGASDGIWGPRTQNALIRFQQNRGLEANGQLTPVTTSALGLDPNNLAASAAAVR